jgi:hypothetical protein
VKKTDLVIQITPHIIQQAQMLWEKPKTIKEAEEKYLPQKEDKE